MPGATTDVVGRTGRRCTSAAARARGRRDGRGRARRRESYLQGVIRAVGVVDCGVGIGNSDDILGLEDTEVRGLDGDGGSDLQRPSGSDDLLALQGKVADKDENGLVYKISGATLADRDRNPAVGKEGDAGYLDAGRPQIEGRR